MVDRVVVLSENGRSSLRGVSRIGPNDFLVFHADADELPYSFDYENLLDGDTIFEVQRQASGPTVSDPFNTATVARQKVKGCGCLEINVVTNGGNTFSHRLWIRPKEAATRRFADYGFGYY